MIDFIVFLLASIGLTFIVTQFYIFKNVREYVKRKSNFFGKLIHCPACFGFYGRSCSRRNACILGSRRIVRIPRKGQILVGFEKGLPVHLFQWIRAWR